LPAGSTWQVVRSVPNPFGGTVDLVVIPEARQRDRDYYREIGETVCGTRHTCLVNFWTDPSQVPESASMPVTNLRVRTATYERHPNYETPHLRLACWLYTTKTTAVAENCFVMPGATVPWEHP
jgi:hypothetical protein